MNKLFNFMDNPSEFEDNGNNIWTESRISDIIFDSHFNPEVYGGSKGNVFINETISFIKTIAPINKYKKILDLGCGPGLYSLELSKMGYDVLGVDYSQKSIDYARKQNQITQMDTKYIVEDILKFRPSDRYDVCLLIYRIFCNFSESDRKLLLNNIYNSLNEGGLLLLDVPSVNEYDQYLDINVWEYSEQKYINLISIKKYPRHILLKKSVFIFKDNKILDFYDWIKHFTLNEISLELEASGFKVLHVYEDVNGTQIHQDSNNLALLCQKA
ncbi:class I SAM-dependent methyltransferase (plasmid) [Staphylococcus haemolyticus]|uniref:class I SAM-dependent methyltransferase n=1 Tax=Staphylococcus haemolyticus TaxID=1283 RepID=UPI001374C24E|nr:class I SAM-dependent methyltransferase [Staphylococcus haemolyticus]QUX20066.1 class I SAM-dependent methyltransferase [Staphylococcus haemolyticus]UCI01031.1 class I SAM-dependent methyltransferase [Staphylococcus haemolyticus]UCI03240.1 class I SAM-dependent methyltransferase [Staphylococcus haemolyticus]